MPVRRPALLFALAVLLPQPARADTKQECVAAHTEAQKLRADSQLKEANERLLACARPECPPAVRSECAKWIGEVQQDVPSLVVVATDANGSDIADVRVVVDGTVVAKELTGQPIPVNPGQHTFRFERDGATPIERKLLLRVGERNRRVEIQFTPKLANGADGGGTASSDTRPESDSGPTTPSGGVPAATWILGGVGIVGLAGFTYFALDGRSKEKDLEKCKPSCPSDDVSSARTSYLIGDVSLGVGVVALAGAAYFLFTAPKAPASTAATAPALRLDFRATPRGAGGVLVGSF